MRLQIGEGLLDRVEVGLSDHFLSVVRRARDKPAFLGDPHSRVAPNGWSSSLADNLAHPKEMLAGLADMGDADVDAWLDATNQALNG